MKSKKLAKITDGLYYVKDYCIYNNKNKAICNFIIKNLYINRICEKDVSFTVRLKSFEEESEQTIPLIYLYDPIGWLLEYFSIFDFRPLVSRDVYNNAIVEIIDYIFKNQEFYVDEYYMGWDSPLINPNSSYPANLFNFGKIEDPTEIIDNTRNKKEAFAPCVDFLTKYIELTDENVSIPLFSYMLLSLLGKLQILGEQSRPDFIMSITGSTETIREKTALVFTNLFKRNKHLTKRGIQCFILQIRIHYQK